MQYCIVIGYRYGLNSYKQAQLLHAELIYQ